MRKTIPPGLSFHQAMRRGFTGRIEDRRYMDWVKTLPCCGCGAPADDPHHITSVGLKGTGTKVPDYLVVPVCRDCHDSIHHNADRWEAANGEQLYHAAMTMLQALYEGRLRFES